MIEQFVDIQNPYLRGLAVFFIVFIGIKVLGFILQKVIPLFTSKTKTDLDDEILRRASKPITLIGLFVGLRFAIGEFNIIESVEATLEGVFLTLIIIVSAVLIYYILDAVIVIGFTEFGKKSKVKINESLVQFFHSIVKIIVYVAAFLIILQSWGVEIGPLLAGLGVAGLAIAFALQSTLSNVFGGISMLLDKSIQVGDVVKLDADTGGKILRINLRSTKVLTFDNELIIVPNAKLAEGNIQNIALPEPTARVVIPFSVAYGTNIDKVKKIVLAELKKIEHFIEDPEPSVKFLVMNDSSLDFKAYFYVDSYKNKLGAIDEANTRIYNALNKNNIEIPFPQMDVNLKK
ncbi:mechanosensitive ion channel family protein [archaeon]|jgi:small-conductance mechanosensitive channel|nr:mechanosensitive ion channel family protein [archaeon]MBT6183014.1 mechanosensitive ion channel family protein [archaeon]MBT6606518.1 mechanosensitive ion channel family protein [archaeon]MBT7251317.1 mechanosensitive ion channel family protein [archaeon]MBT7661048.1 mechanosensitive ion channel family protein [archaeon]